MFNLFIKSTFSLEIICIIITTCQIWLTGTSISTNGNLGLCGLRVFRFLMCCRQSLLSPKDCSRSNPVEVVQLPLNLCMQHLVIRTWYFLTFSRFSANGKTFTLLYVYSENVVIWNDARSYIATLALEVACIFLHTSYLVRIAFTRTIYTVVALLYMANFESYDIVLVAII
jgi:hypothetical protein